MAKVGQVSRISFLDLQYNKGYFGLAIDVVSYPFLFGHLAITD